MNHWWQNPWWSVGVTVAVFWLAQELQRRTRWMALNPIVVAVVGLALALYATGGTATEYLKATAVLSFFLPIVIVALAVLLYEQTALLRRQFGAIVLAVLLGGALNVVLTLLLCRWLVLPPVLATALGAKSVTTPIAMALMTPLGGDAGLAITMVLLSGMSGAWWGIAYLRACGFRDPITIGLALGVFAHAIGTARAHQEPGGMAAAAALALALNGLFTAWYFPYVAQWLLR